jgi:hypothetical protein
MAIPAVSQSRYRSRLEQICGKSDLDRSDAITFLTTDHKNSTCLVHIGRSLTRFGAN